MEHLKISVFVTDMDRNDAINIVNNIQNNMYENVTIQGISNVNVPCCELVVESFTIKGESESIEVICNKTKRYEFIESKSTVVSVGDSFVINCDFYNVVHFEDRWFLYSFIECKALYSSENIKSSEKLREKINLDYANSKFYKRI